MTKSQNTKNEQQKDLRITSEHLTEQWKRGKLPNGYYWIRLSWGGMVIMAYHTAFDGLFELDDHYYDSDEISEVLAPVPGYDEWQAKLEENAQLKERVSKLEKMQYSYTPEEWNTMLRTVNRTKELLRECFEYIDWTDGTGSPISQQKLLDKIDEALK